MAILRRKNRQGKPIGYQVLIDQRDPLSGKRNRQVVGSYRTKKQAETAEANAVTQREQGTLLKPDTTTIGELLDEWLRVEMPRTVRPENQQPYASIIENHLKPTLGDIPARKLTVQHVEKLLAGMQERGLSSSLMTKTRMRLSSALRMGVRWGIVGTNVADAAKPPTITYKKSTIWTPEQVSTFLDVAADDDLWPLWMLMVETGARTSELLGLSWQDLNLDTGTLRIGRQVIRLLKGTPVVKDGGKTASASRSIRLTPGTVSELRTYRKAWLARKLAAPSWDGDFLFCTRQGKPLSANNLRKGYDRIVTAAGVPAITPHGIRKTAITVLLASGASPKSVSARIGHADSRVTLDVYSSITSDMDDHLFDIITAIMPTRSKVSS